MASMVRTVAVAAVLCVALMSAVAMWAAEGEAEPIRVLFIGNSYTYFNNLPAMLSALSTATERAVRIDAEMVVRGGATLRDHLEGEAAVAKIREGGWDFVVLQEQSQLGAGRFVDGKAIVGSPEGFYTSVRQLHEIIQEQGAETVLMLTWARRPTPEFQSNLTHAYMSIGREVGAIVAPIGVVWHEVLAQKPVIELYIVDGSHPGPIGSYLAASVLFAALTGEDPRSLPNEVEVPEVSMAGVMSTESTSSVSVDNADAALIRDLAWTVHNRQRETGGYLTAEPMSTPEDPQVPVGVVPTGTQLIKTWRGSGVLLPETSTELAVDLSTPGGEWRVVAGLDFDRNILDQHHECADVVIDGARISFSHPFDLSDGDQSTRGLLRYELAFTGDSIAGVVRMNYESTELGVSSVVLR